MEDAGIDLGTMVLGLLGGLAIFLFGLDQLTDMLKATAGARMGDLLAKMTTNRFKGVVAGGVTTAVIQSSSVTTVLAVGFVSSGLMSLQQSIGVIMGAEIGTTITAQIIAFKVTEYALVAVVVGFAMQTFFENDLIKRYGTMVFGLGLVFFGMFLMGDATRPLRDYPPFVDVLAQMDNRVLTVLLSAGFTALIQSSSATTGVIIVLGSQGLISLEQGIALVFGANIGTCVTALLASIGKRHRGLQVALVHVTFNVAGVLMWFAFIDELASVSRWLSPAAPDLTGPDRLAAEIPRQIANAHTLFNLANTVIFIWFAGALAWFVTRVVPEKRASGSGIFEPRYLDAALVQTPALALDAARREIVRMGDHLVPMIRRCGSAALRGSHADLARIRELHGEVDGLHAEIVRFLGRVSRQELSPRDSVELHEYLNIATLYESIGDIVETELLRVGGERIRRNVRVSPDTENVLSELADKIVWALETATRAVDLEDASQAGEVVAAKESVNQIAEEVGGRLMARLVAEEPHRTSTYRLESQLIEHYKRIYYLSKRIAKLVASADSASGEDEAEAVIA
ncbi:MAG: Na/Pi cotransporter family protein [Pseudomonadales bacterium]|nr:Na/Pi cotransporter family protein [Pseudomonadales bacterium]NIX09914.1 Na/Pi cotransporter family protein [Pseudomonadales bacterium]